MAPVIERAVPQTSDGWRRTEWMPPDVQPTVPGEYEARTGGGHVFRRRWDQHGWRNSITGLVSTAPLDWRGVVPGSIEIGLYPATLRADMAAGLALKDRLANQCADDMSFVGASLIQSLLATGQ